MGRAARTGRAALLAAALGLAACGGEDEGYPSRDWSGSYVTTATSASTDCKDTPAPPPMERFRAEIRQQSDNRALVSLNPVVQLSGSFAGDDLHAGQAFLERLNLPDSLAGRITPADSFDAVVYDFRATFEGEGFHADYVIRSPDVRALAAGATPLRCTMRYELAGTRYPSLGGDATAGPDGSR